MLWYHEPARLSSIFHKNLPCKPCPFGILYTRLAGHKDSAGASRLDTPALSMSKKSFCPAEPQIFELKKFKNPFD